MVPEFNVNIVLLSYGVVFTSLYVALCAAEQLRSEFLKSQKPKFIQMLPWLLMIGVAVGGVSFWAMHMIGMTSMTLKDDHGIVVPIKYNATVSVFGILLGCIIKIIAVLIGSNDRLYAKSKTEILEIFVESIALDQILSYSELQINFLLISKELKYIIIGGSLAGMSVIGVHFIIMASMEFPGYIVWNGGLVFASIATAILSFIPAYWMFFRLLSIFPHIEFLRFLMAFAGGIAICGMHYFAVIAADFKIDDNRSAKLSWDGGVMNQDNMLYPLLVASMLVLWILTVILLADLRTKVNAYRAYLLKLSPKEKLSDILLAAEDSLVPNDTEGTHIERAVTKRNSIVPLSSDEDDYPL